MRQALNVDAPVTLDELLDRIARETLGGGARDLGYDLSVVDRDGKVVIGERPAPAGLAAKPELEPMLVDADGKRCIVLPLLHEGDVIGVLALGPFSDDELALRLGSHFMRVAEAFI